MTRFWQSFLPTVTCLLIPFNAATSAEAIPGDGPTLQVANPDKTVEITVDATRPIGALNPFWSGITFHPTEYLSTQWGEDLMKLLGEAGAVRQFVRLYNQPENAIRVAKDGSISYDWSEFDRRARLILSTGAKPVVVFFGMPLELAAEPVTLKKRNFGAVMSISPPKDYKQWENLCADFTRHVLDTFGKKEVLKWYFRCWNEPDLRSFWHKADTEEYNRLYDYFAEGVKKVDPDVRIGGGAYSSTSTYLDPDKTRVFFDHLTKGKNHATGGTGAPIDYISFHAYGGHGGGGGPDRDFPDVEYLLEIQKKYYVILDDYPKLKSLPLFMDEWGVTASGTRGLDKQPMTIVRNNEYASAFLTTLVARELALGDETGRHVGSMMCCISGYEARREHDFSGYRTVHTRNGFHKPLLNAYRILDKLAPERVAMEVQSADRHITAIATRAPNKVVVLVTNYQHDQPVGEGPSYPVALSIKTGWHGTGSVRHWRIDKEHSNAHTRFEQIGRPDFPNPLEMEQVRRKMGLQMLESMQIDSFEAGVNLKLDLPCNGVSLFEITKS